MIWTQTYDPLGSPVLSTLVAALPVIVLLGLLGLFAWPAHRAAAAGLATALGVAILAYGMPTDTALASAGFGAIFGLFPIGWIVFGAIFLYTLTVQSGHFEIVKHSVAALSSDRRIQAILIAFSFGAFVEGAAGFGTPVAISAALMIGAGFPPLYAAGLALIANTAPVAFGALGTPIITLANVTGLDVYELSAMAGRQLPFFSLLVPAWMVVTMSGWRGLRAVWPAVLVAGGSFAAVQFAASNYLGPELVDVAGGVASLVLLALFLRVWQPRDNWEFAETTAANAAAANSTNTAAPAVVPKTYTRAQVASAWMPWALLSLCVFLWGVPQFKTLLNGGLTPTEQTAWTKKNDKTLDDLAWWQQQNFLSGVSELRYEMPGLHKQVRRDVAVVKGKDEPEDALIKFNWLSATGTGIFVAAILSAAWLRIRPRLFLWTFLLVLHRLRWPLFTIAAMMAIANVTRYSGTDVTLGLAFTHTGVLYPFFAAMLGWLGVALTGSDTSSNALFGSLQRFTAKELGLSEVLICAANSTGGVMGKMIDAQSIVVAAVATGQHNREGEILRFVFWHSIALAMLMGLLTLAQAYWFTWMVPGGQ